MSVLRNCIEMPPSDFREVLFMRELEEMSYRQISEVADLPVGTVMSGSHVHANVWRSGQ